MTTMSGSLVSSLIASINNSQHDWKVLSAATHTTPSMPGLSLNTGGVAPATVVGPDTPALINRTFQLQSTPLDLMIVIMAEVKDSVFDTMTVYYKGSGFETDSVSLYNAVVAKADPEMTTVQSQFEALVRKKFVTAAIAMSLGKNFVATKV